MSRYVENLLSLGFVKRTANPEWVSAPFIVPKNPPVIYRLTIDYRSVISATEPIFWPLPHIDSELHDVRGSRIFASIDFCSGYWQLPLIEESQQLYSFMTPHGVVQPTRTTQGGCNSAANFQQHVEPRFAELRDNLKAWLDDFLLYSKTELDHLSILRRFFDICRKRNLFISLKKTAFFSNSIKWCGRIIDSDGYRMEPANWETLRTASVPMTADELCQFVHGAIWVSETIPMLHEKIQPLRDILESAYEKPGSRKKKCIKRIPLSTVGWDVTNDKAFEQVREMLCNSVRISFLDTSKILCIHTDASDRFWSAIVTQCENTELEKPTIDQRHEPLSFIGSAFTDTQQRWTTYEQEAFAIIQAFKRLDYMMICEQGVRVFTDHRNLLFAFHPYSIEPSIARQKVMKVVRWELYLSAFQYHIEHVEGSDNTFPDILTRWMKSYRSRKTNIRRVKSAVSYSGIPQSPFTDSFEWPTLSQIINAQKENAGHEPEDSAPDGDGLISVNDRTWIPDKA